MNNKIYGSIVGVMSEIGAISKAKKNQQQGFMYRGVDDVMNALQPLMVKHGIFIVPEVLEQSREDRTSAKGNSLLYSVCKIKYTFFADDGSSVTAITIGEGMDSGDKASNKAMAVAFKYACFQVFCIPTEEMKDPDAESHELASRSKPSPTTPPPAPDVPDPAYICPQCGGKQRDEKGKNGLWVTGADIIKSCGGVCYKCWNAARNMGQ